MSPQLAARLEYVIRHTVDTMPPDVLAERVAWCVQHDAHGVRVHRDGTDWILTWGGSLLAVVPGDLFADDAYLAPIELVAVDGGDAPDDLSSLPPE